MTICRVSQDELNHDRNSVERVDLQKLINERADEIMGNCALTDHEDKTQLIEEAINCEEVMAAVIDLAWMYNTGNQMVDDMPMKTARGMAVIASDISRKLLAKAKDIAESELD